jgi:hypothetical protein
MPRAGWVKPETDQRLSDHISIGVLTRVFPPDLVDRVVKEPDAPSSVNVSCPPASSSTTCWGSRSSVRAPTKRSCACWSRGCRGKGAGPRRGMCRPKRRCSRQGRGSVLSPLRPSIASARCRWPPSGPRDAFYKSWRLMSIDGTCLDVTDTAANEAAFGRPGSKRENSFGCLPPDPAGRPGRMRHPRHHRRRHRQVHRGRSAPGPRPARLLRPLHAGIWPTGTSSASICGKSAQETGADLLWRMKSNHVLPVERRFGDGSFLSSIYPSQKDRRHHTNGCGGARDRVPPRPGTGVRR